MYCVYLWHLNSFSCLILTTTTRPDHFGTLAIIKPFNFHLELSKNRSKPAQVKIEQFK